MTKEEIRQYAISVGVPQSRANQGFMFPEGWDDEKMKKALTDFGQRYRTTQVDIDKDNTHEALIDHAKQQLDGKSQQDLEADVADLIKTWYH